MNSEERPATGGTAYMRIINILCLHALSKHISHVFERRSQKRSRLPGSIVAGSLVAGLKTCRLHQPSSENLNDFRKIVYNRRPVNLNWKKPMNPPSRSFLLCARLRRDKTGGAGKKGLFLVMAVLVAFTVCYGQTKKRSAIQWKPSDCTSPLLLPEGLYDLSQFGKGQYRIDGKMSAGHFNCIYFIFQPNAALNPEAVAGATESSFVVKDTKVTWRSYKTIVEDRPVIRKEAVMPNILPHEKQGNDSDYIWIRVDADSQPILDQLTPAAEEILRDLAQPQG